jgi:alpha-mannosidase
MPYIMRKKNIIFVVPHSHYDVVWAFNKEDYYSINEMILSQVIEMIKEYDFRFLIEQIYLLELIEQRNPKLFKEISKAIKQNKIEIADGQYTMADTMIPIGEILVREILVGNLYCREKFGKDIPVAWAADGFGLNSQMPQVYKKSGYKWLAFRRGLPKSIGYRVSEFIWEGLDSTKIISHWMPAGYRAGLELDKWEESYKNLVRFATTRNILMPCGSGGVPPQMDTPAKVEEWNENHDNSRMIISLPSDFFKSLEKDASGLAEYHGELYSQELENVFPDVVSSRISLKLAYKQCENLLISAEKLSTIAYIYGHKYPEQIYQKLWKYMLFLVNHDVIAGCGIDEIYDEAWEKITEIKTNANKLIRESLFYLSKTRKKGNSILVYNPNNWEVTSWQEIELNLDSKIGKNIGLSFNDKEIPCEILELKNNKTTKKMRVKLGFIASVPALGYKKYHIINKKNHYSSTVSVKGNEIENKYFNISVDDKTGIVTIYDREKGRKLVEGNEIIIDQEIGDLYFHKSEFDEPIESESGTGIHFSTFVPGKCHIHKGPLRTVIDFTNSFYCVQWPYYLTDKFGSILQRHKTIDVRKQVFIYNDERRIDFQTTILSSQSHIRIRIRFDTCMVVPKYSRQTQFGVIDIPMAKSLEESTRFPSLNWLHCQDRTRGVAFFTRGVPINEVKAGNIYYTLLRSVSVLSTDGASGPLIPTPEAMELGEHTYSYSIYPHNGNWKQAYIQRHGHDYNHQMISIQADNDDLYTEFGSFIIKPSNLVVSSLKKAERDDNIILRFFETKGEKCTADITFPPTINSISRVNLLEEDEQKPVILKNNYIRLDVGAFEIVTLKLFLDKK